MRQSDLAILASGGISHTSDNRITATADETLTDWELRISEVQTKDAVSVCILFFLFYSILLADAATRSLLHAIIIVIVIQLQSVSYTVLYCTTRV